MISQRPELRYPDIECNFCHMALFATTRGNAPNTEFSYVLFETMIISRSGFDMGRLFQSLMPIYSRQEKLVTFTLFLLGVNLRYFWCARELLHVQSVKTGRIQIRTHCYSNNLGDKTKQDRRWNADKPSAALDPYIPTWLTTSPANQRPANFWRKKCF